MLYTRCGIENVLTFPFKIRQKVNMHFSIAAYGTKGPNFL